MGVHRFSRILTIVATAGLLVTVGCSTRAGSTGAPAVLSTSPSTTLLHPYPLAMATVKDNGHTVTLTVGQNLSVQLDSTYWTFAPTAAPLRSLGQPVVAKGGTCVPGGGCGTVTAGFYAEGAGQVVVSANRATCGEAMRCVGAAGQYRLTVVIH